MFQGWNTGCKTKVFRNPPTGREEKWQKFPHHHLVWADASSILARILISTLCLFSFFQSSCSSRKLRAILNGYYVGCSPNDVPSPVPLKSVNLLGYIVYTQRHPTLFNKPTLLLLAIHRLLGYNSRAIGLLSTQHISCLLSDSSLASFVEPKAFLSLTAVSEQWKFMFHGSLRTISWSGVAEYMVPLGNVPQTQRSRIIWH